MKLKYLIESLFFVSLKPLTIRDLASFLKKDISEVEQAISQLITEYNNDSRGIKIIESGKKYQMASSPDNAKLVRDFLQSEVSGELTPASLETLTIIAYRGPIKKSDLEKIRGINCSLILRNLLIRGLIEERSSVLDDENEYSVSLEFIKFLGINSLKDLPDYEKFNKNEDIDRLLGVDIIKNSISEGIVAEDSVNNNKDNVFSENQDVLFGDSLPIDDLDNDNKLSPNDLLNNDHDLDDDNFVDKVFNN